MIGETDAFRAAALSGRLAFLDAGATPAYGLVFATERPATGADPGAAALVQILLASPAGSVSGTSLTLAPGEPQMIVSTGDARWVRWCNGDGGIAFDCDVAITPEQAAELGVPERAGEVVLSQIRLRAGGRVNLVSAVLG